MMLNQRLAELKKAYRAVLTTRDRDAIYGYLAEVFSTVYQWHRGRKLKKIASKLAPDSEAQSDGELAVVLFDAVLKKTCSASAKMQWKYRNTLELARRRRVKPDKFVDFASSRGLNRCAELSKKVKNR